ncbi:Coproporphyrin ferrochelatase [hydrothermal vent metagenome]|uniref:Coproporphyrin ferrochelatase n=1 Tax=hydrothermal vent metagenome TaxID=652676 RepID=A0A3B1DJ95_9ZZZZ
MKYDAILIVGFGGPEGREDVVPFLENVLRGRNVPHERMLEVAEHYYRFEGISPINQQVRNVISALQTELQQHNITLPIYWGNRNWKPMLAETMQQMKEEKVSHALGLVLSAYGSYSSCRQYLEDIKNGQQIVGEESPSVDKIRLFYNHPNFITANKENLQQAVTQLSTLPNESLSDESSCNESSYNEFHVAFTAHSLPISMAKNCQYVEQLQETCRLVAEGIGLPSNRWKLVYQSRSGRPSDPWLEPDICDYIETLHQADVKNIIIMPIGFLSDHIEVLYDLDEEAKTKTEQLGITMVRAATVGVHPQFITMLRLLIEERLTTDSEKLAIGYHCAATDVCSTECCPAPQRHRTQI